MQIKMMGSKVLITSKLCITATVVSVVFSHSIFAQSEEPALQEVVVFGVKESLKKAIDLKRESGQLIDAISAEDIGKFPDLNIAESLARITGVQLSRGSDVSAGDSSGSGAGQQVSIRGIRPDLNRATINGQSLGTTTGGRNFNFQTLSPGLVSRLEVYKTPSASMTEGSLGGTVNMVTHQPLAIGKQRLNITGKMFDNQMADDTGALFAGLYSNVYLDGTFGVLVSYNHSDNTKRRDRYESFGWENNTTTSPASATPGVVGFAPRDIRHQIRIEAQEINGGNVALQWLPTENLELGLNYFFSELENHSYGPQTILQMFFFADRGCCCHGLHGSSTKSLDVASVFIADEEGKFEINRKSFLRPGNLVELSMKVRASVKKICRNCKIVRRNGAVLLLLHHHHHLL